MENWVLGMSRKGLGRSGFCGIFRRPKDRGEHRTARAQAPLVGRELERREFQRVPFYLLFSIFYSIYKN